MGRHDKAPEVGGQRHGLPAWRDVHPQAQKAAEAAECVRAQGGDGAYWQMHDSLFLNQDSLSVPNMEMWASQLGYDINNCLSKSERGGYVLGSLQKGIDAGVQGTPSFFINGQFAEGFMSYDEIRGIIDGKLAGH